MGHWNYRLVRTPASETATGEDYYAVHEVYHDDEADKGSRTTEPVAASGETPAEVEAVLERMLKDVRERPIYEDSK